MEIAIWLALAGSAAWAEYNRGGIPDPLFNHDKIDHNDNLIRIYYPNETHTRYAWETRDPKVANKIIQGLHSTVVVDDYTRKTFGELKPEEKFMQPIIAQQKVQHLV